MPCPVTKIDQYRADLYAARLRAADNGLIAPGRTPQIDAPRPRRDVYSALFKLPCQSSPVFPVPGIISPFGGTGHDRHGQSQVGKALRRGEAGWPRAQNQGVRRHGPILSDRLRRASGPGDARRYYLNCLSRCALGVVPMDPCAVLADVGELDIAAMLTAEAG